MDISIASASPLADRQSGAISLSQIVRTVRRHVWLIGTTTLLAAGGSYLYSRTVPRTYTAYSSIALDGDRIAIPQLQGAIQSDNMPDPLPLVRTEVQALSARQLVQDVIDKLHLDQDPEFNPALRPPSMSDQAKDWVKSLLPEGPSSDTAPGPSEAVLTSVTRALSIFQDNRSLVIAIAFTAQDPRLASSVVNTLISDYLDQRSNRRTQVNQGADSALMARITEVKAKLDGLQKQMDDLRSRGDIVALRAGSVGQQQVEELATAAASATVQRTQLEADWNRDVALSKHGSSDALAGVLDSPTISRLRDQESAASAKVAELSSRYGSAYPGVRSATANLAAVRSQLSGEVSRIIASLSSQLSAARDKEANLNSQLSAARQTGVAAENSRAQLDELSKEAATQRLLYQTLLQSEQQTVAQPAGAELPQVRVLSAAVPPGSPSGPNSKLMVGMGGLGGLVIGAALAMLRLRAVDGFDSAPDVTWSTGLGVLSELDRRIMRRGMAGRVLANPAGKEMQSMRGLRERVRYASRKGAPRTVLFTPTQQGMDAAELAAAFARAASASGEQVLLVEADLESPSVARVLDLRSNGLASALATGTDWRDATIVDPLSPLDVLVSDRVLPGGAALLSSVAMQNLLVEAREHYNLVVLSGAPAVSAQAEAMAVRVDLTVLVLDGKGGNAPAQQAAYHLGGHPGTMLAAVLVA